MACMNPSESHRFLCWLFSTLQIWNSLFRQTLAKMAFSSPRFLRLAIPEVQLRLGAGRSRAHCRGFHSASQRHRNHVACSLKLV